MLNSAFDFTPAVIYLPVLEQLATVQFSEAVLLRQRGDAETDAETDENSKNKTVVFYIHIKIDRKSPHAISIKAPSYMALKERAKHWSLKDNPLKQQLICKMFI